MHACIHISPNCDPPPVFVTASSRTTLRFTLSQNIRVVLFRSWIQAILVFTATTSRNMRDVFIERYSAVINSRSSAPKTTIRRKKTPPVIVIIFRVQLSPAMDLPNPFSPPRCPFAVSAAVFPRSPYPEKRGRKTFHREEGEGPYKWSAGGLLDIYCRSSRSSTAVDNLLRIICNRLSKHSTVDYHLLRIIYRRSFRSSTAVDYLLRIICSRQYAVDHLL